MHGAAVQHHIGLGPEHLVGNGELGRFVLLPGARARAAAIAERFEDVTVLDNPRGHTAHLGTLRRGGQRIDVLSIPSGMGTPSTEIVAHELLAIGARRIVRVGSCGSLDPNVRPGSVAILSGAVRDEMASRHLAPVEVPALCHPDAVSAMIAGARSAGVADHAFVGIGHSKASFYAREMGHGPMGAENLAYMRLLARCGVIATEMEASLLFILASARSAERAVPVSAAPDAVPVQTACVLGVYAAYDASEPLDPAMCRLADERAIETALGGIVAWAGIAGAGA
jgi:uridine phosphorylase